MKLTSVIAIGAAAALAFSFAVKSPRAHAEGCADESDDTGSGSGKKAGKFHIEYVNGKPVTVIDTVVSVCGKVPRPSVVYVLTVKTIDYEWETLKQDFMPLILQSVKKAPF